MKNNQKQKFPHGFYWGAATAAHQVEGGNKNDWTKWEEQNAQRLAGKKEKIVFTIDPTKDYSDPEVKNPSNYISSIACDHYNRFAEDFDIAKKLNHNAHRFSIEWSRIEPEEGKFDEREIEHYKQVIEALKDRNIEPFATLWHFSSPVWLSEKGGWNGQRVIMYFSRYVEKIVTALSPQVKFWITINEPQIYTALCYLTGEWLAQKKNPVAHHRVFSHFVEAHLQAYKIIKKCNPQAKVGAAKNLIDFEVAGNNPWNILLKKIGRWWGDYRYLDLIKNDADFIGFNYYFHNRINWWFNRNENKKVSDLGWELYPEGLYNILMDLKKYNKPIYITESGLADAKDAKREWYIKETLKNAQKAISSGVDVRGHFYWSLLDNFEWNKGFWPRFGLVEVNYKTLERKIRKSALAYAEICKNNFI
ncbi:MAG: glycoside hydrolase family 1 protein [Candidatus Doudnabacteria bacterium CG10_big_fil_rev_8_21_14_0_10_41_10]|uniref:Glycoside hydrolase family 1 protein n=1 Tax=Candidatus Doudnabacteria bacterium CG10_big_fil_rev_8_21_14_0_10_41_10 TaxID=1974551 RepID=A0A2H0VCC1_9BACT|nr:MAG: glycoside hydrolase family 1 protein [Candidatus Doudnabacteria bacterium CG10_big_fil_rev_8_21_14_0_10_41_10]